MTYQRILKQNWDDDNIMSHSVDWIYKIVLNPQDVMSTMTFLFNTVLYIAWSGVGTL